MYINLARKDWVNRRGGETNGNGGMKDMAEIPLQQHIAPGGEQMTVRDLASCPPPERWHDWVEYDARAWPRKVEKHYEIIPTICFNCEAACGFFGSRGNRKGGVPKLEMKSQLSYHS